MRMKLYFTLENEKMPIDYRRSIISFIKLSLSEYSENEFKKYYNQKDNIIKPYAFSVFFRHPQINGQEIILEDKRFEMELCVDVIMQNGNIKISEGEIVLGAVSYTILKLK